MLDQVIPFRYLSRSQRDALQTATSGETYAEGDVLIREGDGDDKRVFLLESGSVQVTRGRGERRATPRTILPGHYFGERAVLFDEPHTVEFTALQPVRALTIPGDRFLDLIRDSTPFAQALGKILRDKQGIFTQFDRFGAELMRAVGEGAVDLGRLLPLYQRLEPALHPKVAAPDTVDVGALTYAVRRLPENVTRTLAFYLTETLPSLYSDPDHRFTSVRTEARRRAVYEMLPGKNMVLIRDGISDLVDLVTCLCLFAIEARKIRRGVRDRGGLDFLSVADLEPLRSVWPDDVEARVKDVALHHEDFRIEVYKELNNYNSAHAETWGQQIAGATRELLGCDPTELPADLTVHVVSSNTHSVSNCLSPWLGERIDAVLDWGEATGDPLTREPWTRREDLAYALARGYMEAHPDLRDERAADERAAGILSLEWTSFTGIAVQLVDPARVSWDRTDPAIPDLAPEKPSLIVNIDYAFGEQAEHIVANLTSLFARNLGSVSVLGKAGGLLGERGDILVATGFVEQAQDRFHPVPRGGDTDLERLRSLAPGRGVHVGNVLTVTGTLLQNRRMLHFNRHIWQCVGLEMEGSYFLGHVLESANRGTIAHDVALRFLYYVSDLPLRHDSNLSARLRATEGLPPLYAITREILCGILGTK